MKWNVQCTPVFNLVQLLPGDYRPNDDTSGSLPATWSHVTSVPVTWLPPPASYSLVESETYSIRQFSAFYSHFQVTPGQMTSLPGQFRQFEVTWRHFLPWWPPPASNSLVGCEMYSIRFRPSTATSRRLAVKWHHFQVTSGHLESCDVISFYGTASSCELQPCRKWNVQYMPVFGLLQPLPGKFRSNDVTSRSLPVTWDHVTSFPVTWLLLPPRYSLYEVKCAVHASFQPCRATSRRLPVKWHHFRVTSGHLKSRDVISCHVTASSWSNSLVGREMYSIR